MYTLCNEEPLWMSLCLRDGGQLQYKGSWKKTTLHQQNLFTALEISREKPLQFAGFNSLFLYLRWYRRFTTLDGFSFDSGALERKKELTVEEFRSQYDGKSPVLLTELAEAWPARNKWTKDQLLLNHGEVAFRLSQRSSKKITMKLKDYFSYMELQHDEDPLYIFDDKFGEAAPTLLEDYSVPHLFQEDFFDVLDPDQRPPFRWLIIGPERSGASWHVDPALTSAWNTLLLGRKRWALYPPGRVPIGVTVHVNEDDGDVNIDGPSSLQWWLEIYPKLADHDKPIECTQLPGETIFVPSGWWHCVLNLETTIAVTQNFANASNFEYVCLDMSPGHCHKGVCRAGLLALKDNAYPDTKNGAPIDAGVMNHLDMTRKGKRLKISEGGKDGHKHDNNSNGIKGSSEIYNKLQNKDFLYSIDFLAKFLEKDRDHYTSVWSPSNIIGPREMRQWLHRLWVLKPAMRQLIWQGACLALNVDKWSNCAMEICAYHNLPSPLDEEKFPVGTGSNPVFLVSDHVVKICIEGGLESSVHGLGTELEFYNLLQKTRSPLINHVPEVVASGLVIDENGAYKPLSWDGRGVPDVLADYKLVEGECGRDEFSLGVWSKKKLELKSPGSISPSKIFPYIIIRRCRGDIFAHIRDTLPRDDVLHLASFLGEQLRNLHLLPVPPLRYGIKYKINDMSLIGCPNGLSDVSEKPTANVFKEVSPKGFSIPPEWELIVAALSRRKENLKERLSQWGYPIPSSLIDKVEEYIPNDLALLFNLSEEKNTFNGYNASPTWIHSDIMDDNVIIESCTHASSFDGTTSDPRTTVNGTPDACNVERSPRNWTPTHILDFSDLTIGDPLYDLIPIHLDIFRGDVYLLKQFLESYKLPLTRILNSVPSYVSVENWKKLKRISYRAMCYCILHEENVLGAIFSLWDELRKAESWEKVEEVVWGELNNYKCSG
ncbi:F-box protein At1g78280 isoform X2 [Asparagus officinalis]|nr:F-box protein At1g78280 isoform X2 [Asparagus officinalis]